MTERIKMTCKLRPQNCQNDLCYELATKKDLDVLSEIMLQAFVGTADYAGETKEELKEELEQVFDHKFGTFLPGASFLTRKNQEIAGIILISSYEEKPVILELFTHKMYLKQGIAGNLVKRSMNALIELGYEEVVLYVHPKNQGAISLYEKMGFVTTKV